MKRRAVVLNASAFRDKGHRSEKESRHSCQFISLEMRDIEVKRRAVVLNASAFRDKGHYTAFRSHQMLNAKALSFEGRIEKESRHSCQFIGLEMRDIEVKRRAVILANLLA